MKNKTSLGIVLVSLITLSSTIFAEEWQYQIEPYLMITSIKGDAGIGRVDSADVNVDFDTILDNLESAAMVHFEAHHDSGWGMVFDYGYMDLGGKKSNDNGSSVNVEVRQGVLEGMAIYRNKLSNGHLDYIAGFRWWDNDIELDIKVSSLPGDGFYREVKSDWVDPLLGVRWLTNINENWGFQAQANIGGFGIESDFTSSVSSSIQYKINDLMTLNIKYKATWVDFKEGEQGQPGYVLYDTVTHGPILGLAFNF